MEKEIQELTENGVKQLPDSDIRRKIITVRQAIEDCRKIVIEASEEADALRRKLDILESERDQRFGTDG